MSHILTTRQSTIGLTRRQSKANENRNMRLTDVLIWRKFTQRLQRRVADRRSGFSRVCMYFWLKQPPLLGTLYFFICTAYMHIREFPNAPLNDNALLWAFTLGKYDGLNHKLTNICVYMVGMVHMGNLGRKPSSAKFESLSILLEWVHISIMVVCYYIICDLI